MAEQGPTDVPESVADADGMDATGSAPQGVGASTRPERTGLLVLGMHRSGTSYCTSALAAAGVDVGTDLYAADRHNQRGYWELIEVNGTLESMLLSAGSRWDDWRRFSFPDAAAHRLAFQTLRDLVDRCFGTARLFAIKDPRSCRLAFLWREALVSTGVVPKIVVPIRHPAEVAASLNARDGMPMEKGLLLWTRHVLDALRQTRGLPTALVRYSDLLADPMAEIERIGGELSIRWPVGGAELRGRLVALADPTLRHHVSDEGGACPASGLAFVDRLWDVLEAGVALDDDAALQAIEEEFERATPPFEGFCLDREECRGKPVEMIDGPESAAEPARSRAVTPAPDDAADRVSAAGDDRPRPDGIGP
ncbi:MAG: hypothetical protein EBZ59_09745 [Planctomycetia bacterium]|nr:hypothetical protein [Planctomycetia bacterium]